MMKNQSGFTFIELILSMVLSAILAGIVIEIIAGPIRAYFWYTQRSQYIDMAEMSLESIQSDLQNSLSNSLSLKAQDKNQEINFRSILYKGIALPSDHPSTSGLVINNPLPEDFIANNQDQSLFVSFPAVKEVKDKLYPISMVRNGKDSMIKVNGSLPFLRHPMPFYIVSEIVSYECSPNHHTLERVTILKNQESQKFLLSNQVSDCRFTLLNNQPFRVLVSLSFGDSKTQVKLAQPISVSKSL